MFEYNKQKYQNYESLNRTFQTFESPANLFFADDEKENEENSPDQEIKYNFEFL